MPDRYGDPEPTDLDAPVPDEIWAAQARAQAVANCELCDDDGYRGTTVCDHVDRSEVTRRGIAKCREALTRKWPSTEADA